MSEWVKLKIPDLATIISGATPATNVSEFWDGEIVWITPNDLSKLRSRFIDTSERKISLQGLKSASTTVTPARSVVMSSRAPIGYFGIPTEDFTTNQGCKSFVFSDEHDAEFHYYNFVYHADLFKRYGSGSTFMEISKSNIEKLSFLVPVDIRVQRKIAKILSTVDEVIEKTEAAIDKYQAIKAGMMQDLFTRGIDTQTGKLRPTIEEAPELYKESELGWIPKEWEVNSLKEVSAIEYGASPKSITSNDITNIPIFGSSGNLGYATQSLFNAPLIVVARKGTLNKPTLSNTACWVIDTAYAITPASRINCTWLYYQLDAYDLRRLNESTGVPSISRDYLSRIKLKKPEDTIEQDKIANILMDIDNHILSETISRNKYQSIKQGLMADLLTGKVRVNLNDNKVEKG